MDWVDWLVIGILGFSTVFGLFKGFIHQVISLVTWFAAFIIAKLLMKKVFVLITPFVNNETARWLLAWFIPFLIVILIGMMVKYLLSEIVDSVGLGGADRLLGGGFGLLKGTLIITVMVLLLRLTLFTDNAPIRKQSILLPYFNQFALLFIDPVADFFNHKFKTLKSQVRELNQKGESPNPAQLLESMGWDKQNIEYLKQHPELIESILKQIDNNPHWKKLWQEKLEAQ